MLDVDVELEVVDADVDVSVAVDERVQDGDAKAEMDTTVAIADRKLVVQRWLVALQDVDVELWVVEPNDDKMRKDSDMMQVDVVHCCQVEKEVAILEVEEEVCIAQLAVDEEEEGSDAVEASDAARCPSSRHVVISSPLMSRCLSSRLVVISSPPLMADAVASRRSLLSSLLFDGSDVVASRRSIVVISSLLMADVATAARCCDALGACRDAGNDA